MIDFITIKAEHYLGTQEFGPSSRNCFKNRIMCLYFEIKCINVLIGYKNKFGHHRNFFSDIASIIIIYFSFDILE